MKVKENYGLKVPASSRPALSRLVDAAWSLAGTFAGIGLVAFLATTYKAPLLVPSLGATAVLVYAAVDSPLAQPRNVLGGHFVSALAGVATCQLLGSNWWSLALGVALAVAAMVLTGTVHPPGGATAFVAVYTNQGWLFPLMPVLLGAAALLMVAMVVNHLAPHRTYPQKK